ncbi:hypothetical protein AWC07_18625 [Mycobacterium gastri]|uniref:Uncharacterized protein n=1 Tax=Mycobacterium gastri TaxID=1777 RepID=A0A1X1UUA5_MYCGS|nr:hypothetical protein AWC07_18625 [Mycobacterium gastri]
MPAGASAGAAASLTAVCPVVAAPVREGAGVGLKPVAASQMRTPADAVAEMSVGAAGRGDAGQTREEEPAAVGAPADAVAEAPVGAAGRGDAAQTREEEPPEPAMAPNAEARTADRPGCCPGRRAATAASGP